MNSKKSSIIEIMRLGISAPIYEFRRSGFSNEFIPDM
jgi:hypothetical protein